MRKLLIIDTGVYDNDPIYQAIAGLPVDVTICHDAETPHAIKRVENAAHRLDVPLHSVEKLNTMITDKQRLPDRILVLIKPTEAKEYLINLMRDLSKSDKRCEHPIQIMMHPPSIDSLSDTIELLAYSRLYQIPVWVSASRRYAPGVQHLYQLVPKITPLTQINTSIHSGFYGAKGLSALMREVLFHHADLLCYVAARSNNSEIPISLSAEHSSIYRDAISASFAFDAGLVASISASANHKGNFEFHESLDVTGCGSAVQLDTSLEDCDYINLTETDEFRIEMDPIIDPTLDEAMNRFENRGTPNPDPSPDVQTGHPDDESHSVLDSIRKLALNLPHDEVISIFGHGTLFPCQDKTLDPHTSPTGLVNVRINESDETPDTQTPLTNRLNPFNTQADAVELTRLQFMLLDFIKTPPPDAPTNQYVSSTLRSCLPAIWTLDAINRSITEKQRIARPETHNIYLKNEISEMNAPYWEDYQSLALAAARTGHLDRAIDITVLGIMQNDDRIRQGWFTPRSRGRRTSANAAPRHASYHTNTQAFENQHGFSTIAPAREFLGATQKMGADPYGENPNN